MYNLKKQVHLSGEKKREHKFSEIVHNSSAGKLKGRHGKLIGGYKQVAGRGFRNK